MSNILRNAIITPDGTVLESRHRHDYVTYIDLEGNFSMVDGGLSYLRRGGMIKEDISLTIESDFNDIREGFCWGTKGLKGDKPVNYIPLKDLETSHIIAILDTQYHLPDRIRYVMVKELEYRGEVYKYTKVATHNNERIHYVSPPSS